MPGTRGELFATQIVAALVEIAWVTSTSAILFFALKAIGIYRVPAADEDLGLDVSKHGGSAYANAGQVEITASSTTDGRGKMDAA